MLSRRRRGLDFGVWVMGVRASDVNKWGYTSGMGVILEALCCSSWTAEVLEEHVTVAFDVLVPDTNGNRYPSRLLEVALRLESAMASKRYLTLRLEFLP